MKRYTFALLIALTAALFLTTTIAQENFAAGVTKKKNDLTGTWLVNVECDCSGTSATINPWVMEKFRHSTSAVSGETTQYTALAPFNTVETFHADGTFAENSLLDFIPPQGTPGRGLWGANRRRRVCSDLLQHSVRQQ